MLTSERRKAISNLIKREVVPAIGCTEPIAVSLAVAKATEILGSIPEYLKVGLSGNILKNAMGVGIPGTGMIGLPIAIALGATKGKADYGLEVLRDVDDKAVFDGKCYMKEHDIEIYHIADAPSNLYIDVKVYDKRGHNAHVVIAEEHTKYLLLEKDGKVIFNQQGNKDAKSNDAGQEIKLDLATVWEFAVESPIEELLFIDEAMAINESAANFSFAKGDVGHRVGSTIKENLDVHFGNSTLAKMLACTSAACDARMSGEKIAVMSNSGSGNQGIAITLPVVCYAKENGKSSEMTTRALIMAHLTSIYIKQLMGRLSALCGCVVASTGVSMALVYLMGGSFLQASYSVKNMIATLTGMICDGAKPACSLKIASGINTAYLSALMAINDHSVTENEGIVTLSVDDTIKNFAFIGREAMLETDSVVLRMMSENKH